MKKVLTICIMLTALVFMAYAGSTTGKDVSTKPVSMQAATAPVVVTEKAVEAPAVITQSDEAIKLAAEEAAKAAEAAAFDALGTPRINSNLDDCTTPFPEGFETVTTPDLPDCWLYDDVNADSKYWKTTTSRYHTGTTCVEYMYHSSNDADDWLFSAGVALVGGTEYQLKYWVRTSGTSYDESWEIKYGTTQDVAGMTDVITATITQANATWLQKVHNFTPAASGTYYIGIHCNSPADYYYLDMDDFELGLPPTTPYKCCYGDVCAPTCEDMLEAECLALGGTWTDGVSCLTEPDCPIPPAGALCCNAIEISGAPVNLVDQTNCGLGNDYSNTCLGNYDGGEDIIYAWTVLVDGNYSFDLTSNSSYVGIVVDDECPMAASECLAMATASGADVSIPCTYFVAGTYYIMIDTWPSPACIPSFALDITQCADEGRCCYGDVCNPSCLKTSQPDCDALGGIWTMGGDCSDTPPCPVPQAGELCCNAFPMTIPGTVSGNTSTFENDYETGAYDCTESTSSVSGKDVVYTFTAEADMEVTFNMCTGTTAYDAKLFIFEDVCGNIIACREDGCANPPVFTSSFIPKLDCVPVYQGHVYYVVVDGYGASSAGDYTLDATICEPCQPEDIPWNDECTALTSCPVLRPGTPTVLAGTTTCAQANDCVDEEVAIVWECFTLEECGTITVAYCGSDGATVYNGLATDCECLGFVAYSTQSWTTCGDGNATQTFNELPAGTYYIPIHPDLGPNYTITITYDAECCVDPINACAGGGQIWVETTDGYYTYTGTTCCHTVSVPCVYADYDETGCTGSCYGAGPSSVFGLYLLEESYIDRILLTMASDCQMMIFTDCHDPSNSCVVSQDALASGNEEFLGLTLPAGVYYLSVSYYSSDGTACGPFTLEIWSDMPLPVELVDFDAIAGDRSVTLNWATASESNVDRYDVMANGELRGSVDAKNLPTGGEYSFTDVNLTNGTTYDYKVVTVGMNNEAVELFSINATPAFAAATITEYALHQNFPNPFNPETKITFDLVDAGFVNLKVYNLLGQQVATLVNGTMDAGRHIVNFEANSLPSGLYLYRMETESGFSAQKKMILMK